jgi:hypothetical protein
LGKIRHSGIMNDHLGVDPQDAPAALAQPETQFRFLARNEARVEASNFLEGVNPRHEATPAALSVPDGRVQLDIAEQVVAGSPREALATPAAHDRYIIEPLKFGLRAFEPAGNDLTVAIEELHPRKVGLKSEEVPEPSIACPGRGEGPRKIKLDDANS